MITVYAWDTIANVVVRTGIEVQNCDELFIIVKNGFHFLYITYESDTTQGGLASTTCLTHPKEKYVILK
jgi:hypothetical protein